MGRWRLSRDYTHNALVSRPAAPPTAAAPGVPPLPPSRRSSRTASSSATALPTEGYPARRPPPPPSAPSRHRPSHSRATTPTPAAQTSTRTFAGPFAGRPPGSRPPYPRRLVPLGILPAERRADSCPRRRAAVQPLSPTRLPSAPGTLRPPRSRPRNANDAAKRASELPAAPSRHGPNYRMYLPHHARAPSASWGTPRPPSSRPRSADDSVKRRLRLRIAPCRHRQLLCTLVSQAYNRHQQSRPRR
mmetsp:Transcript_35821/g.93033  ORF Transcript_35821/g.93033 Transcript_35821/m.93033 type:complete len:246 (-) Transcript_35821:217-954(-)